MNSTCWYSRFAKTTAHFCGRPRTFTLAVAVIVAWLATGPVFGFSDTWQLVVNTTTTIITFLMVFLIQNTQNRDTEAIQVKLDELIRATAGAHTALLVVKVSAHSGWGGALRSVTPRMSYRGIKSASASSGARSAAQRGGHGGQPRARPRPAVATGRNTGCRWRAC